MSWWIITRKNLAWIVSGSLCALVIFVGPVLIMVWSGFRRSADVMKGSPPWEDPLTLENFERIFRDYDFGKCVINSLIVAGGSTLIGLVIGVPAAYSLVRSSSKGLGWLLLAARMAPGVLLITPIFRATVQLGVNLNVGLNFATLILVHMIVTLPLVVWLVVPSIRVLPVEVEEAAMLDGAALGERFFYVVVPLISRGLAVASVTAFVASWNTFLFPLVLATHDTMTLPVMSFSFIGQGNADYGGLMAAVSLMTVPAILLSMMLQPWVVRGMTGSILA